MLMSVVLLATSCSKDDEFVNLSANGYVNEYGQDPEDPSYSFFTEHVDVVAADTLWDNHNAWVVDNLSQEASAKQEYSAKYAAKYDSIVAVDFGAVKTLENLTIAYKNGYFDVNGNTITASLEMVKAPEEVYFSLNGKTYSYPKDLKICQPTITRLETGKANGDKLNGNIVVVVDGEEYSLSVEFIIDEGAEPQEPEHNYGYEWDDHATLTGENEASVNIYPTVDGERTGDVESLKANVSFTLKAGAEIVKESKETLTLYNTTANLTSTSASFKYQLGGESFSDNWTVNTPAEVTFVLPNDETISLPLKANYEVRSEGLSRNGEVYSNNASLYADNFKVDSDVQIIRISTPEPEEPTYKGYKVAYADQWAITRIFNQAGNASLVVLVGALENIENGDIVAVHYVLEGSSNQLPDQLEKVGKPADGSLPFSMRFNSAANRWEYGMQMGTNRDVKQSTQFAYWNWSKTATQLMSNTTVTDLLGEGIVWYNDGRVAQNGKLSFSYKGQTIVIVDDVK